MQAAEGDFACLMHFLNAGHERYPCAVAELDVREAEFVPNLLQHDIARCMAVRVPEGRERNHPREALRNRRNFRFTRPLDNVAARLFSADASGETEHDDRENAVANSTD